ncbi:MAG: hypothetical protein ACHQ53_06080 [Polyangiales bacterium]
MDELRFCPFCGEAFEGHTHCPEHELELLPWAALARAERVVSEHETLAWFSPRLGRGWVAAGAVLFLLAFVALPLGRVHGSVEMGGSMLRLALAGTPRLWLVPAAAWAVLMILYRRRTPRAMRAARLAVLLVGGVPAFAAISTWLSSRHAVALLASRTGQELRLELGAGVYLIGIATLTLLVAGMRLGVGQSLQAQRNQGRSESGR